MADGRSMEDTIIRIAKFKITFNKNNKLITFKYCRANVQTRNNLKLPSK